jgi:hypothetical protein
MGNPQKNTQNTTKKNKKEKEEEQSTKIPSPPCRRVYKEKVEMAQKGGFFNSLL